MIILNHVQRRIETLPAVKCRKRIDIDREVEYKVLCYTLYLSRGIQALLTTVVFGDAEADAH